MSRVVKLDRRDFLRLTGVASGGLVLGVYGGAAGAQQLLSAGADPDPLNAFVAVANDGTVSIWVAKMDMGQGVRTSLPMIVADELDARWDDVRVVQADAHPSKYGRMMTVGSSSVRRGAWMDLRRAGASARQMLVAAAAGRWGVDPGSCRTEAGAVLHPASGRRLSYGELAEGAAMLPVPEEPALKDPADFKLVGTPVKQLDTPARTRGEATFGIDVRVPGMLFGTVVHPPMFGGAVGSFDASAALAVEGVRHVVEISSGIVVVADNTWAAFEGAGKLEVTWDGDFAMSSDDIFAHFAELADGPGAEARAEGDIAAGMAAVATRVEAVYQVPYLAHATMEPMNCTAHVQADRVEVWAPTQNPQGVQSTAARLTGVPIENVVAHPMFLGCGLGRRSATDFVEDAVETAMKVGVPVQVLWSRTEDMRHDLYRPAAYARFEGGVDAAGNVAAYRLRAVAQPLSATGSSNGRGGRGGGGARPDGNAVDGLVTMPYDVANLLIDYGRPDPMVRVPTGYWRSVGPSGNCFITESIIDELAHAAGRDPLEFRLSMLGNAPRIRRALEVAAEQAGWDSDPPAGRARGIGLVIDKGGHVAVVAEVSVENGFPRVHRVTVGADYGLVINPLNANAQTVGCVVNGLTAALYGEISIRNGRAVQSNFHDYQLLRIDEMPAVDVHLIDSHEEPGGVGEPALPPTIPALANAVFALTGTRIRRLPIMRTRL